MSCSVEVKAQIIPRRNAEQAESETIRGISATTNHHPSFHLPSIHLHLSTHNFHKAAAQSIEEANTQLPLILTDALLARHTKKNASPIQFLPALVLVRSRLCLCRERCLRADQRGRQSE